MNPLFINFVYVISAALFIFGLKMLSSPATARRGNLLSSLGMLIAIVITLMNAGLDYESVYLGLLIERHRTRHLCGVGYRSRQGFAFLVEIAPYDPRLVARVDHLCRAANAVGYRIAPRGLAL